MRERHLGATELCPTSLGFGTATMMGRLGAAASLRVMKAAQDAGINYFDTARSYGYGQCERVLGDLLQGQRDRVIVTSKFGIEPLCRSGVGLASRILRPVVGAVPGAARLVRRSARTLSRRGAFDVQSARRSLETSLRELRTDYLDVLLLHGCEPDDVTDELVEFLDQQVTAGTIRYYGTATSLAATVALARRHPAVTRIAQIPSDVVEPSLPTPELAASGVIVHSTIRPALARLTALLAGNRQAGQDLMRRTGLHATTPTALAPLLLAHAAASNPNGVVVFSCRDLARLNDNVDALANGRFSPEQLAQFEEFVTTRLHRGRKPQPDARRPAGIRQAAEAYLR